MKTSRIILSTFVAATATLSCTRNQLGNTEDGSGLSTVTINLPAKAELENPDAWGKDCEKLNFKMDNEEIRGLTAGTNKCDIALKLLSHYKLSISPANCDAGITGTKIVAKLGTVGNAIEEKIQRGCDYSVLLELGRTQDKEPRDQFYLSNAINAQNNLNKSRLAENPVRFGVKLYPTELGISIGFPGQASVSSPEGSADTERKRDGARNPDDDGKTDLDVTIEFGDKPGSEKESDAKPRNDQSSNQTPASSKESWDGLSFAGSATWVLEIVR